MKLAEGAREPKRHPPGGLHEQEYGVRLLILTEGPFSLIVTMETDFKGKTRSRLSEMTAQTSPAPRLGDERGILWQPSKKILK